MSRVKGSINFEFGRVDFALEGKEIATRAKTIRELTPEERAALYEFTEDIERAIKRVTLKIEPQRDKTVVMVDLGSGKIVGFINGIPLWEPKRWAKDGKRRREDT